MRLFNRNAQSCKAWAHAPVGMLQLHQAGCKAFYCSRVLCMLLTLLQSRHDLLRLTSSTKRVAYAFCVGGRVVRSGIHIQHQPGTVLLLGHAVELER